MKKIYLPLFLIVLIFIGSCEKDNILDINENTIGNFEVKAEKISFRSLPSDVQYFLNEKFKGSENRKNLFGPHRADIPAIKNKNAKGQISYTIALKKLPDASNIIYFDNMVITEHSKDQKSVRILRYKPTLEWYHSTERLMNNYSGLVSFYAWNGDFLGEISLLNGEGSYEDANQKDFSTTCTYTWSSTLCVGDVNGGDSYSCTYNYTESCTTNYISPLTTTGPEDAGGTGSPTGGGAGGGDISTTPIPDEENQEKPCEGDPVKNTQLAPQRGASGIKGALHGCTRYGGGCSGGSNGRNKNHVGIDIKNDYGDPIYAMYDGKVHSAYYQPNGAGYVTRIISIVNGETIIYQYFHMQQDRLTQPGTVVSAGDVIGLQGDSGNLRNAIKQGGVESHVHIKVSKYKGSGDSSVYSNYTSTDPADYLGTKFDDNGQKIDNNCN